MSISDSQRPDTYRGFVESLASRLHWLESTAGTLDMGKFINAKILLDPYYGFYVLSIWREPSAVSFLIGILDQLKQGTVVPLIDVASYYVNDKRRPSGMQLSAGRLADVW